MEISFDTGYEFATLKLSLRSKDITVCVVYRPPNLSFESSNFLYERIRSLPGRNLLLMGDFNLGGVDWASHTISDISNSSAEEFLDAIDDLFIVQHVTEPTRSGTSSCSTSIFKDREGSTLDLIFTSISLPVGELEYLTPLNGSDHTIIHFNIRYSKQSKLPKKGFLFNRLNVELVNQAFENSLLSNFPTDLPLDVLWNMFLSECNSIMSAHIPTRPTYTGHIPFYLKNSEFREMRTIKYKKWKSYCNFPSLNSLSEYRIARKMYLSCL